jgi:hypothetical protein
MHCYSGSPLVCIIPCQLPEGRCVTPSLGHGLLNGCRLVKFVEPVTPPTLKAGRRSPYTRLAFDIVAQINARHWCRPHHKLSVLQVPFGGVQVLDPYVLESCVRLGQRIHDLAFAFHCFFHVSLPRMMSTIHYGDRFEVREFLYKLRVTLNQSLLNMSNRPFMK